MGNEGQGARLMAREEEARQESVVSASVSSATSDAVGFTPGPWSVVWGPAFTGTYAIKSQKANTTPIAQVSGWKADARETGIANAQLIAAAPELLVALRDLCRANPFSTKRAPEYLRRVERGWQAIAKALGTPSPKATEPSQSATADATSQPPQSPSCVSSDT